MLLLIMGFDILIYMYKWKYKNNKINENSVIIKYNTKMSDPVVMEMLYLQTFWWNEPDEPSVQWWSTK